MQRIRASAGRMAHQPAAGLPVGGHAPREPHSAVTGQHADIFMLTMSQFMAAATQHHINKTDLVWKPSLIHKVAQTVFRRAQLKALIDVHSSTEGLGGNLTSDETSIIRCAPAHRGKPGCGTACCECTELVWRRGALDLSHKQASCCMTPLDRVRLDLP